MEFGSSERGSNPARAILPESHAFKRAEVFAHRKGAITKIRHL